MFHFGSRSSLQEPAQTAISTLSATSPQNQRLKKNHSFENWKKTKTSRLMIHVTGFWDTFCCTDYSEPTCMMELRRAGSKVIGHCNIEADPFTDDGGGLLEHPEAFKLRQVEISSATNQPLH